MTKVIMMGRRNPGDQIHISLSSLCSALHFISFFSPLAGLEMFAYLASDQIHTGSVCGTAGEKTPSSSDWAARRGREKAAGEGSLK